MDVNAVPNDPLVSSLNDIELYTRHAALLEDLLGSSFFRKERNHPAYKRWELCKALVEHAGVFRYPEEPEAFTLTTRIHLDSTLLVELTGGSIPQLMLGATKIPETLRRQLQQDGEFQDFMVELGAAGALIGPGREVNLVQKAGWPDIQLQISELGLVLVECKHLTSPREQAVRRVLQKASNQIKTAEKELGFQPYGVVWLDVTVASGVGRVPNSEDIFKGVQDLVNFVEKALSGEDNSHVGLVLVIWDEYVQMGEPPGGTSTFLARRVLEVPHVPTPKVRLLPEKLHLFEGLSIWSHINWAPRELEHFKWSSSFAQCSHWNVDKALVMSSLRYMVSCSTHSIEDYHSTLYLAHMRDVPNGLLLVITHTREDGQYVDLALPLNHDIAGENHSDVSVVLRRVAEHFALLFRIGSSQATVAFCETLPFSVPYWAKWPWIHRNMAPVINPENHSYQERMVFNIMPDRKSIKFGLLIYLDTTVYIPWVKALMEGH